MKISVHVEGVTELGQITPRISGSIVKLVATIADEIRRRMAGYPPETRANQPGPFPTRWYQRHFGPRWARADGSIGGLNTSQDLQNSWKNIVSGPLERTVWSSADYAPFVQSAELQSSVMRDIGWHTDEQVVDEVMSDSRIKKQIGRTLDKALEG